MKLYTDRFLPHISFNKARRIYIQNKWNKYRGRDAQIIKGMVCGGDFASDNLRRTHGKEDKHTEEEVAA